MKKKVKFLNPIKGGVHGCGNCGLTIEKLPMNTRLYNGFGGWMISIDGKHFFEESVDTEFEKSKTLMFVELAARKKPNRDYRAILNLPLRSAEYQRQGKNNWVLVRKGLGFA